MLWKVTWRPDVVVMLAGIIVASCFLGNAAVELLRHFGVAGFNTLDDTGSVLVATLCFHGTAILAAVVFFKMHDIAWRDALGWRSDFWKFQFLLILMMLAAVVPVMLGLKLLSTMALHKLGWPVEDQRAVEMFSSVKSVWLRVYLGFFAVVLAPVAEEFVFRGLLFSAAKKFGWRKSGWVVVSLLFALIHFSAPIFLPLFVLALGLTWLYETTGGLLAPILAHSLFNAANLALLFLTQYSDQAKP